MKPVEAVLEALEIIDRQDTARASQAYALTGGAITSHVGGARGGSGAGGSPVGDLRWRARPDISPGRRP